MENALDNMLVFIRIFLFLRKTTLEASWLTSCLRRLLLVSLLLLKSLLLLASVVDLLSIIILMPQLLLLTLLCLMLLLPLLGCWHGLCCCWRSSCCCCSYRFWVWVPRVPAVDRAFAFATFSFGVDVLLILVPWWFWRPCCCRRLCLCCCWLPAVMLPCCWWRTFTAKVSSVAGDPAVAVVLLLL